MKRMNASLKWLFSLLVLLAAGAFLVGNSAAQETKAEQQPGGPPVVNVEVQKGTVVLVEGNHLITRLEDGKVEAIAIPEDFRFHMEGQLLSVHELKPGMLITHEVITTTQPMLVKTVDVKEGTVWNINGPRVIIRDKNNKLHDYTIPDWAEIIVDDQKMSVFDLRRGMKINTTIVTEETVHYVERQSKATVTHPAEAPRETMKESETRPPVTHPPVQREEKTEEAMTELPKTASPVPLAGLLGLLSLAASFGLRRLRKEG